MSLSPDQQDALAAVLRANGETVVGHLRSEQITGGRSNWTFRLSDDCDTRWILRRPPEAGRTPSAHDIGRELRIAKALHTSHAAVPVPRPIAYHDDPALLGAPFSLTEFVHGRTIKHATDLQGWTVDECHGWARALVDVLVRLHEVEVESSDLRDLGGSRDYAIRQLDRWTSQWERVKEHENKDVLRLIQRLREQLPPPAARVLVHGDYRIDNVILSDEPFVIAAVVDWELATVGAATADVALMCAYRHPAFNTLLGGAAAWTDERFPSPRELAGMYADRSGSSLAHWEFFLSLAFLKVAVIAQGIDYRYRAGVRMGGDDHSARRAVPELVTAGLSVRSSS